METFKDAIVATLEGETGLAADEVRTMLGPPPKADLGDFAFPCFKLAKERKSNPVQIAGEIAGKLAEARDPEGSVTEIRAVGPYVNFFLDRAAVARKTLGEVSEKRFDFGRSEEGVGQMICIDYSSPNIAKPFNIGHIRSTAIGHAIYNIFEFLGYECAGINHLGDWGTQFGKLIVAFKKWGSWEDLAEKPIHKLLDLYVKFHEAAEKDPSLDEEARAWFKKLEDGDPEARDIWQHFRDLSLAEFQRIYADLGIDFDTYTGESFYEPMLEDAVAAVEEKGLAEKSQGALIVDLEEYGMPPCLLRKADGATLYATRDIAALLFRAREYKFAQCLYVVGGEQSLHFQQLFKVIELMGFDWADRVRHIAFGLIRFKDAKLSTRKGNVIFLEEVLEKSKQLVRDIIREKNPDLEDADEVAHQVGVGAVVFNDLKNRRMKDVSFDWNELLNFDGRTGPYLQYTHARICSIFRKHGEPIPSDIAFERLETDAERNLVTRIANFPAKIRMAAREYEPSIISEYLLDLAEEFNSYYANNRILIDDEALRDARLCLAEAVRTVLQNGLKLLGLEAPERM